MTITAVDDPTPERPDPDEIIATALWCNRCMLPSGVRATYTLRFGHGASGGTARRTMDVCVDCSGVLDPNGNVIDEVE